MKITKEILEISKDVNEKLLTTMEREEDWVVKNPEIYEKLETLVNDFKRINEEKEINKETFLRLLAFLHTGKFLEVINDIKKVDSKFVDDLLTVTNELNENNSSRFAKTFAKRLLVIYRINALPRVFSPERIDALSNAIKNIN